MDFTLPTTNQFKIYIALLVLLVSVGLQLISKELAIPTSQMIKLVISTDGRYILSSHRDQSLWLWDVIKKNKRRIAIHVNSYSPYFIKDSSAYIFQDSMSKTVYQKQIEGNNATVLFHLPYLVSAELINRQASDYYTADKAFNLYHYHHGQRHKLNQQAFSITLNQLGKPLDLSLSSDETLLLSSAFSYREERQADRRTLSLLLWDSQTGRQLHHFTEHYGKTVAAMSPSSHLLVSADENGYAFLWTLSQPIKGEQIKTLFHRQPGRLMPDDFCEPYQHLCLSHSEVFALRFISERHYLRFTPYVSYAVLYEQKETQEKDFLKLTGKRPFVDGFNASLTTVTSPKAHILAMANAVKNGIIVYRFNPQAETLALVWQS